MWFRSNGIDRRPEEPGRTISIETNLWRNAPFAVASGPKLDLKNGSNFWKSEIWSCKKSSFNTRARVQIAIKQQRQGHDTK